MGNAAVSDTSLDVTSMMQHLEVLQREREQLDAQSTALAVEDEQLVQRVQERIEERERIERRLIEIDDENAEIDARREEIEDQQRAIVCSRDALDHEYTELYALLDRVADGPAEPVAVAPSFTDRIVDVGPTPALSRPAPWRTTLVIVPDPVSTTVVAPAPTAPPRVRAKPWETWRGVLAISTCLVALITVGAIVAWPEPEPPAPTVDPKAALEMVRAALVPDSTAPASTPAIAETPAVPAPAIASTPPVAEKTRVRSKRSKKKKR